ncbi:HAD-like protein [Aaosphaeria arxii CBS 175.79]|uniref:HAD-like protein n=1 Tax=Aaosphaeria arxii CBS 175.79 TaxID=1450172 RepID=A0A6A5YAB8_9PLEO|nr:HAD-like protein [Aaosphaeria arxii CBS 175.79]KAF2022388.1 HAD-like protein [Aaosphaeria arxii CBS 175.79]
MPIILARQIHISKAIISTSIRTKSHWSHTRNFSSSRPRTLEEVRDGSNVTRTFDKMSRPTRPRRFAPLDPAKRREGDERPTLKGIVFDVDGTLCLPQTYMFGEMRSALGITKSVDILDHIYALPTASEQEAAQEKIRAIERKAMASQEPQSGLVELMEYLDSRQIQKGICTRNFDAPVEHLLTTFLPKSLFAPIITREFRPPKPDPAGILHIAKTWMHEDGGNSLIMVGDSIDDMTAGFRAGAATVLLVNDVNRHLVDHEHTDLIVERLDDLIKILEDGFEGRA